MRPFKHIHRARLGEILYFYMRRLFGEVLLLGVLCFLCIPGAGFASSLQISWNSNTETDLSGYKVYYGNASGAYTSCINVRNANSVVIEGFFEGRTYYLAVTAYDFSNNESGFSQEVSVYIPDNGQGILNTIFSWAVNLFSGMQGVSSQLPQYNLKNFSTLSQQEIEELLNVVWIGRSSVSPDTDGAALDQSGYMIRDVIAEAGIPLDLSSLYPAGTYFFLPITDGASGVYDDMFSSWEPGAYLFMVSDSSGEFLHILRISVLEYLSTAGDFENGIEFFLEDSDLGITLTLSPQAIWGNIPIAIGIGSSEGNPASALFWNSGGAIEFTIAPYGLVLSEPAEVRMVFNGSSPTVEYYDESERCWVAIHDVREEDGMVVFSTQSLGRFKVYSAVQGDGVGGGDPHESKGGCFISTCSG